MVDTIINIATLILGGIAISLTLGAVFTGMMPWYLGTGIVIAVGIAVAM